MTTYATLVSSLDAPSGGVFDFPSLTLTGYSAIQIICSGITVTTDGTDIKLTFYVGGVEITTPYRWVIGAVTSAGADNTDNNASTSSVLLNSDDANYDTGNDTGEAFGSIVTVDNPTSTALHKKAQAESVSTGPTGALVATNAAGYLENAGAIDGLKISGTSSLTAGKVRILGLA